MLATLMLFNPIQAMVGFVIFCICVAIVIILGRWLLSLTGLVIPQPLMYVLGLVVFLVLLLFFLDWVGAFNFSTFGTR
jgi:hypothetical protein